MNTFQKVLLGAGAVGAGVLVVRAVADSRARALTPAVVPPFSSAAEAADWEFFRELNAIASDDSQESAVRNNARRGARMFKKYWLDAGHAGWSIKSGECQMIYGNWCGAGYGGSREPVDAIDSACRTHDLARGAAFA